MPQAFEQATAAELAGQTLSLHVGTRPSDLAALLPPRAAERLRQLAQHVDDLHRIVPQFSERQDATSAKIAAERRLVQLSKPRSEGGFYLGMKRPSCRRSRGTLATLTAEAKRLADLYEVRSSAWATASRTLGAVMAWLREGRGTVLQDFDGPPPKLAKNETNLSDAIENRRRYIRTLASDLHRIRSSCYPSSHCKTKAAEKIDVLAQRGAVSVSQLIEHDGALGWPTWQVQVSIHNTQQPGAVVYVEVPDLAILAFVHRDALLAAINRAIDEESDDANSLSLAERQGREAEVMADLLSTERDESSLVWQAMEKNLPVGHRSDCSPQAILQCELITVPTVEPSN